MGLRTTAELLPLRLTQNNRPICEFGVSRCVRFLISIPSTVHVMQFPRTNRAAQRYYYMHSVVLGCTGQRSVGRTGAESDAVRLRGASSRRRLLPAVVPERRCGLNKAHTLAGSRSGRTTVTTFTATAAAVTECTWCQHWQPGTCLLRTCTASYISRI